MASSSTPFLFLLFLFLSLNLSSAFPPLLLSRRHCVSDTPPILPTSRSRKMLEEMKNKMKEEFDGGEGRRPAVEWDQLRRVPSGPDPLHHSGGSPKKPKTP